MEKTQLSSKNNLFTGNTYQNNDTWINILNVTKLLNKVLKMVAFQLFCPTPVVRIKLSFTLTNVLTRGVVGPERVGTWISKFKETLSLCNYRHPPLTFNTISKCLGRSIFVLKKA